MNILGIESTCDETAAAVVRNGSEILSHCVASSVDIHQRFGGVFPELASRRHIDAIIPVVHDAMQKANVSFESIDAIAVAQGPGLIGSLLIGLNAVKGLAVSKNKAIIGVNHVEAHLYAAMMRQTPQFPALGFVLSGGHTLMLKVYDVGKYELLSSTVDDAIGEAFDKSATILGLPYPGGPAIEMLARQGNEEKFSFSAGKVKKHPLAFSFSGLKTAVLYAKQAASPAQYPDIAASFQATAFKDVVKKAGIARKDFSYQSIIIGGGVSNNQRLRSYFAEKITDLPIYWPSMDLTTDNAMMIAGLAYHKRNNLPLDPLSMEAIPRLPFWNS